jgi:hypothetical protein
MTPTPPSPPPQLFTIIPIGHDDNISNGGTVNSNNSVF